MSRQVIIFLHMDDRHPGYILDRLEYHKIPVKIVRGYDGDAIATLEDSTAGLVFMGGSMSVNDNIHWIDKEIELIREALVKRVPLLGHCLGGQLIAKALGGRVTSNPVPEVGWHDCYHAAGASAQHWLKDLDDPFTMFHWHSETFSLPTSAELLFSSAHCRNQAFSLGDNVLAMQCHPEMTEPLLEDWINSSRAMLTRERPSVQSYEAIRGSCYKNIVRLNRVADHIYDRWISTVLTEMRGSFSGQ